MTGNEKIYFEKYKKVTEVKESNCPMGNKGFCHTCMYRREYDSNFHYFENAYCTMIERH